jgi:IS30 family transposase
MIPDRNPIAERPAAAQSRLEPGHCEYDSVVSNKRSHSTFALAVVVERTTRFVSAMVVPNLKPIAFANAIVGMVDDIHVVSLTTDNGIENKQHSLITKATGVTVYHTDPYSSWQKGSVENANKMLRRYFPKGTDFSTVSQAQVDRAVARINQKPRKILGYKSAIQVAYEKGIISSQRKALSEMVVS